MKTLSSKAGIDRRRAPGALFCACSVLIGLALLILSRGADWFGEWYATHIFPVFPVIIGGAVSILPFSLLEILIYIAAALILVWILYFLFLVIFPKRRRMAPAALFKAARVLLFFVCAVFMIFELTCGVNYERDSFADITGRQIKDSSKDELRGLCELLIVDVTEILEEIESEEEETVSPVKTGAGLKREARDSMKRLGEGLQELAGYYPNPKPVVRSESMSKLGLTGIYSPFTVEANYNKDIPGFLKPYTMCHELAHLKGFMREDEAGFIAYLACRESPDPGFRYSGAMNALMYALPAYRKEAAEDEYVLLIETVPEKAMLDFHMNNEYWERFRGRGTAIANKANDAYLKANSQSGGVKSYGGMVGLLLAEYRADIENALFM